MANHPDHTEFSLSGAENQAIAVLSSELKDHLDLTKVAFSLIGRVQTAVPSTPLAQVTQARKVCVTLLVRISNDLRCAALVAVLGYSLQTLSLVASMFEVTFTLAAIGSDNKLAQKWINHDDPTRLFMPVKDLIALALTTLKISDPASFTKKHYLTYRQLCMAKHANPVFQMQHGHQRQGDTIVSQNGPDLSDQAIRAACFALLQAAGLASVAAGSFLNNHVRVPRTETVSLRAAVDSLGRRFVELNRRAVARWGKEDPFPGKWRL